MRRPRSLVVCLLALALPLCSSAAAEALLVVPFDNSAREADLDWVGESFAVLLTERMAGFSHILVPREERLAGLERLGLPPVPSLTRASLLRLGEELGADRVILGRFRVQDGRLLAEARWLDLNRLALSDPVRVQGPFDELLALQTRLAWRLLGRLDPDFPLSWEDFRERFPSRRAAAFESYVRGLLAFSREQQLRYFLQAARSDSDFVPPVFRLGQWYFEDQDFAAAADWFSQVPDRHPLAADARFYLSLCWFYQQDVDAALQTLSPVAESFSVKPVWNNLGVFASRGGRSRRAVESFDRALALDPNDPDLHFNLGLHLTRRRQWARAVRAFEDCVALDPDDTEAWFLLAHALEARGRPGRAARARQRAVGDNPALRLSLERRELRLDRLLAEFDSRLLRFARRQEELENETPSRARHVAVHLRRGQAHLARGRLEQAGRELTQAILLAPDSYRAHFLLARVYQEQGRTEEAVSELKAALWNRETLPAHLRLAELYLALDRRDAARHHVDAALALDPQNEQARALADRLSRSPAPAPPRESKSP